MYYSYISSGVLQQWPLCSTFKSETVGLLSGTQTHILSATLQVWLYLSGSLQSWWRHSELWKRWRTFCCCTSFITSNPVLLSARALQLLLRHLPSSDVFWWLCSGWMYHRGWWGTVQNFSVKLCHGVRVEPSAAQPGRNQRTGCGHEKV